MKETDASIGTRIRTRVPWVGVPEGTEGVVDERYDGGVMIAWDLPDSPLPDSYQEHDGRPAIASGILRDGFSYDELEYLEVTSD